MAIAYVQEVGQTTSSAAAATTFTVNVTNAPTTGNLLVLRFGARGGTAVLQAVVDTKGNSWRIDNQKIDGTQNNVVALASCVITSALTSSDSITLILSAVVGQSRSIVVDEYSAVDTLDKSATASGAVTSLDTGTTGTTEQADELVVAAFVQGAGNVTFTKDASYSAVTTPMISTTGATNTDRSVMGEYKVLSATGTQRAQPTSSSAAGWLGVIVTYKVGRALLGNPIRGSS